MAGSKSVFASPLEKIHPMGANPEGGLERPGGQGFGGLDILRVDKLMGQGNGSTSPSISWGDMIAAPGSRLGSSETASGNCEFSLLSTGLSFCMKLDCVTVVCISRTTVVALI